MRCDWRTRREFPTAGDARVAVLVDCDNIAPEILEHALRVVAQFGRVILRRGYGNQASLGNSWQDTLVRFAFTPCRQYAYAKRKNSADIALALDAMEILFDQRAEKFCLVTSDSDLAQLCRKLRERGATEYIVGEPRTPAALRNASDQFFEWAGPARQMESRIEVARKEVAPKAGTGKAELQKPQHKRRPKSVIEAVALLAADTPEGTVSLAALGTICGARILPSHPRPMAIPAC